MTIVNEHSKMFPAYSPPEVEVVTVVVEQGFSNSEDEGMILPDWEII